MQIAKLNEVLHYFNGVRGCQIERVFSIMKKQHCEKFCNIFARLQIKNFTSGGNASVSFM